MSTRADTGQSIEAPIHEAQLSELEQAKHSFQESLIRPQKERLLKEITDASEIKQRTEDPQAFSVRFNGKEYPRSKFSSLKTEIDKRIEQLHTSLSQEVFIAQRTAERLDEKLVNLGEEERVELFETELFKDTTEFRREHNYSESIPVGDLDSETAKAVLGEKLRNSILQIIASEKGNLDMVDVYIKKYAIFLSSPEAYNNGTLSVFSSRNPETTRTGAVTPPEGAVDMDTWSREKALETIYAHDDEFFADVQALIESYPYFEQERVGEENRKQGRYTYTDKKSDGIPYRKGKRSIDVKGIKQNLDRISEPLPDEDPSVPRRVFTAEQAREAIQEVTKESQEKITKLEQKIGEKEEEQAQLQATNRELNEQLRSLETQLAQRHVQEAESSDMETKLVQANNRATQAEKHTQDILQALGQLRGGLFGGIRPADVQDIINRFTSS